MEPKTGSSSPAQNPSGLPGLLGLLGILVSFFLFWRSRSQAPQSAGHSQYPQDSTDCARSSRQNPISVPLRVSIESTPPPPTPEEKAAKDKRDSRESKKLVLECLTAFFVFAYATIAVFQWCQMKRANNLTAQALDFNKKMFNATQAAGFSLQT
jgi:hypothetical protein